MHATGQCRQARQEQTPSTDGGAGQPPKPPPPPRSTAEGAFGGSDESEGSSGWFKWKGWTDRVNADPQFVYKVLVEQVRSPSLHPNRSQHHRAAPRSAWHNAGRPCRPCSRHSLVSVTSGHCSPRRPGGPARPRPPISGTPATQAVGVTTQSVHAHRSSPAPPSHYLLFTAPPCGGPALPRAWLCHVSA